MSGWIFRDMPRYIKSRYDHLATLICFILNTEYEGKFDRHPPRALFKGSYGAYRVEGSTLDQKYALEDTGLTTDPWEKFNLEYVQIQGV